MSRTVPTTDLGAVFETGTTVGRIRRGRIYLYTTTIRALHA
jgi:hypothetical protein